MKYANRITALLVVVIISISISAFAQDDIAIQNSSLVTDSNYEKAIAVLTSLNILSEADLASLEPDNVVTRAEFVTMIVKMLGLHSDLVPKNKTKFFNDVGNDIAFAADINIAANMGIIKGYQGSNFLPDENITYAQALSIIVNALGYEVYANQYGGYPSGVLKIATDKKINRGAIGEMNEPITADIALKLIYNALDVDLLEKVISGGKDDYYAYRDKTVLTERLKVYKNEGIVSGTKVTTLLDADSGLKADEIIIGNTIFKMGSKNVTNLLGYQVEYYYRYDDNTKEYTLVYISPENTNKLVTVKADNISEYSDYTFNYEVADDKTKKLDISKDVSVIYNGRVYNSFLPADLKPAMGEVLLLDNNNDNAYDVVFVNSYENYRADSIDGKEYRITDTKSSENITKVLDIDEADSGTTINITREGNMIAFGDILQDDILSIYKSKDNKNYIILVTTNIVDGKIEEISDENNGKLVTVAGKKYPISSSYIYTDTNENAFHIGDFGIFYISAEGKIAGTDFGVFTQRKFAYLLDVGFIKGLTQPTQIKLLTTSNKKENFKCANYVILDGLRRKSEEVHLDTNLWNSALTKTANIKMIVYKLNEKNEIIMIDTVFSNIGSSNYSPNDDTLSLKYPYIKAAVGATPASSISRYYKTTPKSFIYDTTDPLYERFMPLKENVVVFNWPIDGDEYSLEAKNLSKYTVDYSFVVEGYVTNDSDMVDVLVEHQNIPSDTYKNRETALLVDKFTNAIVDDQIVKKIYGARNGVNGYSAVINNDLTSAINTKIASTNFGDVIMFTLNYKGELIDLYKIFDAATKTDLIQTSGINSNRTVFGTITKCENNIIYVDIGGGTIRKYPLINAKVYKCDMDKHDISVVDLTALHNGNRIFLRIRNESIIEAVIYVGNGFN